MDVNEFDIINPGWTHWHGLKPVPGSIREHVPHAMGKFDVSRSPVDDITDGQKMKIITQTFNELYDKNYPVRQNLYYMDSIEEIRIIKGLEP